jgi:hypothetical protein
MRCYLTSSTEQCFPKLLVALCKNERGTEKAPRNHLSNMQALAKQLADVFDFVLRFDDAKVSCDIYHRVVIVHILISNTRWLTLPSKTIFHTIVVPSTE